MRGPLGRSLSFRHGNEIVTMQTSRNGDAVQPWTFRIVLEEA